MAIPATAIWEVRTTGHTDNPGGFNPGNSVPGTDYSQQDSAQVVFDGATILASTTGTSATITLSGHTVTAADRGNFVRITGGTNFTNGIYEIVSVNTGSNQWTLDRSCTSGAGAAMTGRMGGACLHPGRLTSSWVSGNKMWIKSGTYVISSDTAGVANSRLQSSVSGQFIVEGYASTRGDLGTKPVLQAGVNAQNLVVFNASGRNLHLTNIELDGNRATYTSTIGITSGSANSIEVENCHIKGCSGSGLSGPVAYTIRIFKTSFTDNFACSIGVALDLDSCIFYDNDGAGGSILEMSGSVYRCLFYSNTSKVSIRGTAGSTISVIVVRKCIFYGNTARNVYSPSDSHRITCYDCVAVNTTGYGFEALSASNQMDLYNCAGYNNSSGNYLNIRKNEDFITLSGDPFTDAANGDFSLNDTPGAGALLKSAGYATAWPLALTPNSNPTDVGAWEDASGSGGVTIPQEGQVWPISIL